MDRVPPAAAPPSPPGASLRQWIRQAQQGETASYPDLLHWAAERARGRGASEPDVRQGLVLIDRLRHTYDPRRCPQRWIDGILRAAGTPGQ